jgi:hypothetical protein
LEPLQSTKLENIISLLVKPILNEQIDIFYINILVIIYRKCIHQWILKD